MTYQLRYVPDDERDPETLICESLEAAVRAARVRLQQAGVSSVVLMSDGFVVRALTCTDGPVGAADDQILANAGIYRLG